MEEDHDASDSEPEEIPRSPKPAAKAPAIQTVTLLLPVPAQLPKNALANMLPKPKAPAAPAPKAAPKPAPKPAAQYVVYCNYCHAAGHRRTQCPVEHGTTANRVRKLIKQAKKNQAQAHHQQFGGHPAP